MRNRPLILLTALALAVTAAPTVASAQASIPTSTSALAAAGARGGGSYISTKPGPGRFPLVAAGRAAPIVVDSGDFPGVVRVAGDLRTDLRSATGVSTDLRAVALGADSEARSAGAGAGPDAAASLAGGRDPIILGTLGRSALVDRLAAAGKIDTRGIAGKWETSLQQVVENPLPGVRRAFVIAGSDQRGTIFGVYDVSKRIGVSPWHFWDDVPVPHADALYALPGRHTQGTPKVKYRGFFINDENPATGTWAPNYFGPGKAPGYSGGLNAGYYAKVFETMLRLKANYLWPAVWGRAFAEDDPANHETASRYGVVMGTSHEAPMMRGIEEWNRHAKAAVRDANGTIVTPGSDPYGGTGEWSFRRNRDAIVAYWRDGARRMKEQGFEGVITLGMRGNGDVSLPDGDGIDLMSSIIETQRGILAEFGLQEAPQVQTLYKEVQRYWDKGYQPPQDVTVVFCDDNWGNMRKLPHAGLPPRGGGYGLYYHFDYVGDGRNYKWVDTTNLVNAWEQLHLSYSKGVDRLWVVNVGDLKNEELPTQFFLDYAWNPDALPVSELGAWERKYAAENFGPELAPRIAEVLSEYGRLQSRRKPELLNRRITGDAANVVYNDQENPYTPEEMDAVVAEWQALAAEATRIKRRIPAAAQDAYFQLVDYQVQAGANLYELRRAQFTNIRYAAQGRAATNDLAAEAEARFAEDQALSEHYNTRLAGGKWAGWQTQPKIGYGNAARYNNASWQQPQTDDHVALPDEIYPHLKRIEVPAAASMGVESLLPELSPWQSGARRYIEIYNKGTTAFDYRITTGQPWLRVTPSAGRVDEQVRVAVTVDWRKAPDGLTTVPISIEGPGGAQVVQAAVRNPALRPAGFAEAGGYVAVNADHYDRRVGDWQLLPDIGKVGNGMAAVTGNGRLEYRMTLTTTGPVKISAHLSPRNNVLPGTGLKYAISVDDQPPQTVDIIAATGADDTTMNRQWARNTSDNVNVTTTTHVIDRPGTHTLTFHAVDPTVILQRLVVDTGGVGYSYLGPAESRRF
ncbi:glycosyl hydrolase 115 family protein [Actinoplanes missouriensis]|uniref:glycosyl hydrolase 115 family protein n=1 Tax=Actinoplanes missouriensis TaxID=1866 RepID=UPI0033CE7C7C